MTVATSVPSHALVSPEGMCAQTLPVMSVYRNGTTQSLTVSESDDAIARYARAVDNRPLYDVDSTPADSVPSAQGSSDATAGTVQWPFPSALLVVGDRFGPRNCAGCSSDHKGQDFNPGNGAPVLNIADGVVWYTEDGEASLGVHVIVDHEIQGQRVRSVYAHLQHGSVAVKKGERITAGQVLGLVGSTGNSTGPHLHFEILLNGTRNVDPLQWLYDNLT
jgi:murein DD-endopeptidase MepM/ murein hydrolase activator NlpD